LRLQFFRAGEREGLCWFFHQTGEVLLAVALCGLLCGVVACLSHAVNWNKSLSLGRVRSIGAGGLGFTLANAQAHPHAAKIASRVAR